MAEPITKEQMKLALESASVGCSDDLCRHAAATKANDKQLFALLDAVIDGDPNPILGAYCLGLHVGYRLHQVELESTPKEEMN